MPRQKVRDVSDASEIRGIARPVNTYVRPADPAPSSLHDLARGLGALDKGLGAFMKGRQGKADDAEALRGKAAFYQNNQQGYADAIRQGLIPANSSPQFMQAWKKEQGNLGGIQLRERFNTEYNAWEGRNSNDPAAFQQFMSTFIASNISNISDPDVLRGLNPHLDTLLSDGINTYSKESGEAVYNGAIGTTAAVMGETLDYAEVVGSGEAEGINYDNLWTDLMSKREAALATGIRAEDFDKQLVDTIADKAEEYGNDEMLQLLDRTLPGSDVKLSSLPEFRDRKAQSASNLSSLALKRMDREDKEAAKLAKMEEDTIVSRVSQALAKDPSTVVPEEVMARWRKVDPKADETVAKLRKTLTDAVSLESPGDIITVERLILEGATERDVMQMAIDGHIKDPSTLSKYLDRAAKRQKGSLEGQGILSTSSAKRFTKTFKERTMPSDWNAPFAPDGLTDEGVEATRDFEEALMQWEVDNPNASMMERESFVNDMGEMILKRIDQDERQYTSPEDAQALRDQQEAVNNQQLLEGQQQQQQGQLGAERGQNAMDAQAQEEKDFWRIPTREEFKEAMELDAGLGGKPRQKELEAREDQQREKLKGLYQQDEPPGLDDLEPDYRERLEEEAKQQGITPEEYNMEIWKKLKQALLGETIEGNVIKSAYSPEEGTDNGASEAIKANFNPASSIDQAVSAATNSNMTPRQAATKPIRDLIGKAEGTDGGRGYNETYGFGKYTGGDVELTSMTLGQVKQLQAQMLDAQTGNKRRSSAVGRYQILSETLGGLMRNMKLTDDMKFTSKLQDDMADELMKGRGYDKWLSGKMSDDDFFDQLSQEWASLPGAGGDTHYGQRLGVNLEELKQAASSSSHGVEEAIDAAIKGETNHMAIATKFLGMDDRKSDQAKTLGSFIKRASGLEINPATTAWCAAFANAVLEANGVKGTGKLNARSFLNWGTKTTRPAKGDVVVLWRGSKSSWQGHVGFFDKLVVKDGKKFVRMLGGNQGNSAKVSYNLYPLDRVLGYRRMKAGESVGTVV